MKRLLTGFIAAGSALAAVACGSDHGVVSPSAPTTSSALVAPAGATPVGKTGTGSLVGTWVSDRIGAQSTVDLAVCSNIQLNITSQTASQASGTLSMTCPGNIDISGNIVGQLGSSPIPLTWNGTATMNGAACPFSLAGTGTPLAADRFHLTYSGSGCMGPIDGSTDLRFAIASPSPSPSAPAPAPTGVAADMIPFSSATIRNSPLTLPSWPITTAIRVIEIRPNGMHVEFSKQDGPGRWPDVTPPGWDGPLQWTLGMALNVGGHWYASAPIELWHGLQESGGPPSQYALNWFYDPGRWAPMTGHQPATGETIGIFACAGDCRNNTAGTLSPVKERSNVVSFAFPAGTARFTF